MMQKNTTNNDNTARKALLSILISFLAFLLLLNVYKAPEPNGIKADDPLPAAEPGQRRKVIYEAVFLNKEEMLNIFQAIRGETPPYEQIPNEYHVTTAFRPQTDLRQFYGSDVTIHCDYYKAGEIMDTDGNPTENEGVLVKINSSNPIFQNYIDNSMIPVFHITGSYSEAAKYTSNLDFTSGAPINYSITGKFGGYLGNGIYVFSTEEADSLLSAEK